MDKQNSQPFSGLLTHFRRDEICYVWVELSGRSRRGGLVRESRCGLDQSIVGGGESSSESSGSPIPNMAPKTSGYFSTHSLSASVGAEHSPERSAQFGVLCETRAIDARAHPGSAESEEREGATPCLLSRPEQTARSREREGEGEREAPGMLCLAHKALLPLLLRACEGLFRESSACGAEGSFALKNVGRNESAPFFSSFLKERAPKDWVVRESKERLRKRAFPKVSGIIDSRRARRVRRESVRRLRLVFRRR